MSIRHYAYGEHPAGFIGYRVAVMVDCKHIQKYFTTNGYDENKTLEQALIAHELHVKLLEQKLKAERLRKNKAIQTKRSEYSTGVKGIALRRNYNYTRTGERMKTFQLRYIVQGSHHNKVFNGTFPVTDKGWEQAVKYLAKKKEFTRYTHLIHRRQMLDAFNA